MNIAIANDVAMAAEALRRVIVSVPEHQVLWIARTGREAIQFCAENKPDLILMDLIMPDIDGVEATRTIMQNTPCAILVVTGSPQDNVNHVFRALGAGALDVTATPFLLGNGDGISQLLAKIKTIGKLIGSGSSGPSSMRSLDAALSGKNEEPQVSSLVALGSSTGGPVAVAKILAEWTPPPGCAVVVVQHIDEAFATNFAKWLGDQTTTPVKVIASGEPLVAGTVQIAKTSDHLVLGKNGKFHYDEVPRDLAYRPSVDVFFRSVAQNWHTSAIGVLLTGMGRDGAEGLLEMRRAGKTTVAQDQASSAVYGMPRAAAELEAAQVILPLDQIAKFLQNNANADRALL